MKEKGKEAQVPQSHDCEVCGEKAVVIDSGSSVKDTPHWYCYYHHMMWTRCITHERMVTEWQKTRKDVKTSAV
jgi:hypothetical protein